MDANKLKKFAQGARSLLLAQVGSKLGLVLADGSAARREAPAAVKDIESQIARTDKQQVIEKVAYTWFNRFTALRFMDANGYTSPRIVTPEAGQTRPEILADAAAGHLASDMPQSVTALLDGRTPSRDAQGEAYRLLLVAACNHWHRPMSFLFKTIADYTELLMPDDLLSDTSILARLRAAMTDDDCKDVEIIGWLYQFYISEKKDQVFAGLKRNVKITAENIPAATQLFTPHWIVRYLVENSLGRLWLLNRPHSTLATRMDYYIAPEQPEADFLHLTSPKDIRICDPACGSGHMLTYAFDLLHAIYEEEGFAPADIPALILTHNLFGIEIDDRAGALAAFALVMKAAGRLGRRRFLRMTALPQICVLQDVTFTDGELREYMAEVGRDLFTSGLVATLGQFGQAKNFGSLIVPALKDVAEVARVIAAKPFEGNLFLRDVHARVQTVLRMAAFLSPKYHVVVANPPYMGSAGMNPPLKAWVNDSYPTSKADLMTCFMERCASLGVKAAFWGMINLPSWLFLSSFVDLRAKIISSQSVSSLLHLGRGIFGSDFGSTAFVVMNRAPQADQRATYRRLFKRHVDVRTPSEIEKIFHNTDQGRFVSRQKDFDLIDGSPIAYWASTAQKTAFAERDKVGDWCEVKQGLATADNDRFLRLWHEVSNGKFGRGYSSTAETLNGHHKWFPYNKGGEYRRWYGNFEFVVNWEFDGKEVRNFGDASGKIRSRAQNTNFYFKEGATWTFVSSGNFGVRFAPVGSIFDVAGSSAFAPEGFSRKLVGALASKISSDFLSLINPTLNFQVGNIAALPFDQECLSAFGDEVQEGLISYAKSDWDAYETSWDFSTLPLLSPTHRQNTLGLTYDHLRQHWQGMTDQMQTLEEQNNRIFIDAYGLAEELTHDVPLSEITLTCNPAYRYGGKTSVADRETRLRADTVAEFLSYAVGCMFGRYSLNAPGLILANQGETLADYLARIPEPSFAPDADNVIPMLDADWFADDITERFRKFLRVTFGEVRFQENLAFIEEALGKDIRKYFTRDFYDTHVRRYKKRPIYWMFSSPKGTFNAGVYMHRYRPDTVSVLLNEYLRPLIGKLQAERLRLEKLNDDASVPQSQRTKAGKDMGAVAKQIDELTQWEREVIFPLAQSKIEIDLDDGVKANYPKFGAALKPIKGLEASDDE